MRCFLYLLTFLFGLSLQSGAEAFEHAVKGSAVPWTHTEFDASSDKFSFAIHSDLTGGERPRIFETAMAQLALLRPEFVISVGDLIEGGGNREELIAEWESFDSRARIVGAPLFYVGGNHDLSSELERTVWKERYGPHYYHFRYRDVLFLVLDSEDMTFDRREEIASARAEAVEIYKTDGPEAFAETPYAKSPERTSGAISTMQADHFVQAIEANPDVQHTFVFVHKPVWLRESGTPFFDIESALTDRSYTVFNGHEHIYIHRERLGRDYIQLATTGGEQFPDKGLSEDHLTLVTVSGDRVDIVNLMLAGIRDKFGATPNDGSDLCFAVASCDETQQ
ncbi:metallophosphoesterase family protein [Ruegeria atlantica]|uniref:metallophosphoesterase family protein n=1 Tax=Ruegeria atlantica TaxID=81569 RepID=UPI00249560E3|nr:metallophosphoesterase family protein [Ruegeria atlantica]